MSPTLYSLVYTSQATQPLSIAELDQLLEGSRINNERLGLTGMLVHLSGSFIQILEGSQENVTDLFHQKIAQDPRHFAVEIASEGPIEKRQFAKWTMAFENLDGTGEPRPEGFSEFVKLGITGELATGHQSYAIDLLSRFRQVFGSQPDSPTS